MGTLAAIVGRSSVEAALAQARVRAPLGKTTSTLPGPGLAATTPVPKLGWMIRSPGAKLPEAV
jgi:hypothetical protein